MAPVPVLAQSFSPSHVGNDDHLPHLKTEVCDSAIWVCRPIRNDTARSAAASHTVCLLNYPCTHPLQGMRYGLRMCSTDHSHFYMCRVTHTITVSAPAFLYLQSLFEHVVCLTPCKTWPFIPYIHSILSYVAPSIKGLLHLALALTLLHQLAVFCANFDIYLLSQSLHRHPLQCWS